MWSPSWIHTQFPAYINNSHIVLNGFILRLQPAKFAKDPKDVQLQESLIDLHKSAQDVTAALSV